MVSAWWGQMGSRMNEGQRDHRGVYALGARPALGSLEDASSVPYCPALLKGPGACTPSGLGVWPGPSAFYFRGEKMAC